MKVLLFSDVHANLPALKQLALSANQADALLCLGDVVGYNAFPNECIDWLKDHQVVCIRGNHDQAVVDGNTAWFNEIAAEAVAWTRSVISKESVAFLKKCPLRFESVFEGKRLLAVHGSPSEPLHEYVMPYEAFPPPEGIDVLALGHTHVPFVKKFGERIVFNPGSVGQPRDGDPRASFAWIEFPSLKVKIQRATYGVRKTAEANRSAGLPVFLAERLFNGI